MCSSRQGNPTPTSPEGRLSCLEREISQLRRAGVLTDRLLPVVRGGANVGLDNPYAALEVAGWLARTFPGYCRVLPRCRHDHGYGLETRDFKEFEFCLTEDALYMGTIGVEQHVLGSSMPSESSRAILLERLRRLLFSRPSTTDLFWAAPTVEHFKQKASVYRLLADTLEQAAQLVMSYNPCKKEMRFEPPYWRVRQAIQKGAQTACAKNALRVVNRFARPPWSSWQKGSEMRRTPWDS